MKYFSSLLLLFIGFTVTSCQELPETSISATTTIEAFPSPSPKPTFPSIELVINPTPTPLDFSRFAPITADNAANLKPFLVLAHSRINSLAWSPDGKFIVAATSHGLKLYSSDSLTEKPVNLSPFLSQASFVEFSPKGTAMVWIETDSSGEYRLWLWNLVDGEKNSLSIPQGNLVGLSFNSSGQLIIATVYDNSIQIWQAESGKMLASFGGAGDANGVDFSSDGRLMVSVGHADLMAHVWNVDTGEEVGTIGKPNMYASSADFSPLGNTLALSYQGAVQLWDVDAWRETKYSRITNDAFMSKLAFSPDGNLLAAPIYSEYKMYVLDSTLAKVAELEVGPYATNVEFSPDGESLAVISISGLELFDTSTWELQDSPPSPLGPVQQMVFRPDSPTLVSIHEGSVTVAWDLQTATEIARVSSPGKQFLSPDGKLLAVGTESGEVSIWDVDTGKMLKSYQRDSKFGVGNITFSQDNHLLTISYPGPPMSVGFWEWETEQEPKVFPLNDGLAYIETLTPDGRKLAVQIWENEIPTNVGVWDTQTQVLHKISERSENTWISSVALHPNNEILAVGDHWSGTISLYDTNSGALLEKFNEPSGPLDYDIAVNDIVFSNDGKLMVTIVNGGPVIWDLENHMAINIEAGCISSIESIVFSQDDKLLMLAGDKTVGPNAVEGRVCIWETQTGQLVASLGDKHLYTSKFATFNPDGTMLALDDNGTIWLWGFSK